MTEVMICKAIFIVEIIGWLGIIMATLVITFRICDHFLQKALKNKDNETKRAN